jgi:hypothetical protein
LSRQQRASPAVPRIFDGEKEAKLIALACSKPPKGRARWTLRLLENKVVELGIVERASDSTIGRALKKNRLKPHRRQCWVIPPKANSAFVAAMEDVLVRGAESIRGRRVRAPSSPTVAHSGQEADGTSIEAQVIPMLCKCLWAVGSVAGHATCLGQAEPPADEVFV